ncbi:MAG: hypothetical protein AVDCRST_MAG45-629, partial [uncultured Solirubrobacterales bacterium]
DCLELRSGRVRRGPRGGLRRPLQHHPRHRGGREGVLGRRPRPAHDLRPADSGREDSMLRQRRTPPRRGRRLRGRGDDPRRGRISRRPGGHPAFHQRRA